VVKGKYSFVTVVVGLEDVQVNPGHLSSHAAFD